jgi:hypothetical protein
MQQTKFSMLFLSVDVPFMLIATLACSTIDELDFAKWHIHIKMTRDSLSIILIGFIGSLEICTKYIVSWVHFFAHGCCTFKTCVMHV